MADVFDYAKYFIKREMDTCRNTFDGNMKLQKLLLLANLISLAKDQTPLFDDPILAFSNGCVIEKVRLRYKNDFKTFLHESVTYNPELDQREYDILNLTIELFGSLSARELSDLNHSFAFWEKAYEKSIQPDGFKDKNKAVVSLDDIMNEIDKIQSAIEAFRATGTEKCFREVVNDIKFFYDPDNIDLTDDILEQLEVFSKTAEDNAYSVYRENGSLVIY